MNRAKRLYAWLLRLYPRSFRNTFEEEMLQTFLDSYVDLKFASLPARVQFWLLMLTDECNNISVQHVLALQEDKRKHRVWVIRVMLSALLLIPLFAICYAALVSALLVLPHPAVSGIGFLLVLGVLVLLSAIWGIMVSSLLVRLGTGVPARLASSLS